LLFGLGPGTSIPDSAIEIPDFLLAGESLEKVG